MKYPFSLGCGGLVVHVFVLLSTAISAPTRAEPPQVVELWPGKVPEELGNIGPERVIISPKLDHEQVEVTEPTRIEACANWMRHQGLLKQPTAPR